MTREQEEYLDELLNDFTVYLDYVYGHIGLPEPTPLQQRISEIIGANPSRLILEAARGTGKSWIAAIYTTWRLLRNVDEKVLIVSASGPKAIEIATFVRRLFEDVPLLAHLKPDENSRDSVLSFDVAGCKTSIAPSVSALGITSQITGKRATLIIADDVEVPSNSMTELMREKLLSRVGEFEALLVPDMPSSVVFLGTPQSMESIYSKLPYETIILPAEVPEDETVYEGKLDPWILKQGKPGDATDKVRFPEEVLLERKAGMGLSAYKLQYNLDTTLSDSERFPLKLKDLIVHPLDRAEAPLSISYAGSKDYVLDELPCLGFTGDVYHKPMRVNSEYEEYDTIVMGIDPSGQGTDEAACSIIGVKNGYVYIIDVDATDKGYSDEALVWFANKAKEFKVQTIVPEKNFGNGMFYNLFTKTLAEIYPCTVVDDFVSKGQKEVRIIDTIEPILTNHKLVIDYDLVARDADRTFRDTTKLVYSLMYQFTHITRERQSLVHDDRLDSLAIGIQYIQDMVLVNTDQAIKDKKDKELEQWLYEKIYGKYNKSSSIGSYLN